MNKHAISCETVVYVYLNVIGAIRFTKEIFTHAAVASIFGERKGQGAGRLSQVQRLSARTMLMTQS